ncbi:MAG TPA: carboxypeptidase-like regulatory domain-containing protein [Kofleriaceae bacterium]|nr:carboxypeptidase-like regulatory domain-containing protein [Kofleriaceae bacterium]
MVNLEDSRPISGAVIVLRSASTGQPAWTVKSDERGRFRVDTAPGSYGAFVHYGTSSMCMRIAVRPGTTALLKTELKVERTVHFLESSLATDRTPRTPLGRGRAAMPACL